MAELSLNSLASQRKKNNATKTATQTKVIAKSVPKQQTPSLNSINRSGKSDSTKDAQKNIANIQALLEKMQTTAQTNQSKAEAQDIQLYGQQLNEQTNSIASMQAAYQQMLTQQQALTGQYGTDLQSQVALLKEQNNLLTQQGQVQSNYFAEQKTMMDKQQQLQNEQLARATEENKYTSLIDSVTNSQNAATANRLQQQMNRRRAIKRFGILRTS